MLMESKQPPIVVPMWLTGYENLMPAGRPFPQKFIPHFGTRMSVTFGEPIPAEELQAAMQPLSPTDTTDTRRSRVTQVIHNHVEGLGQSISGKLLTSPQNPQ